MALGLNYQTADSGDILPIVKYDAKAGRAFRIDRTDGNNTPVDITHNFVAVFDMENIETGWIAFNTNTAPDFRVGPIGRDIGPQPSDQHKPGFRVLIKLGRDCGGDVREIASTAKVALRGFDQLHNDYLQYAPQYPGKLPIVKLTNTVPVTTGEGSRKSTNYQPVFKITGWVNRPADLVPKLRGAAQLAPQASPQTNGDEFGSSVTNGSGARPATGSTVMKPPAAARTSVEEDFG